MRNIITSALLCFSCFWVNAQQPTANPLLKESNDPIAWDRLSPAVITEATAVMIDQSNARIKSITSKMDKESVNPLMAFDALQYRLTNLSLKLNLIASTYESDATRNTAQHEQETLSLYINNLYLNEGLYGVLKHYEASATKLPANHQKFLRETLFSFEKNGMKLDAAGRKELEHLNEKLVSFGLQFDNNIAESRDSLYFQAKELEGVPEAVKESWKQADGRYLVHITGPQYREICRAGGNPPPGLSARPKPRVSKERCAARQPVVLSQCLCPQTGLQQLCRIHTH